MGRQDLLDHLANLDLLGHKEQEARGARLDLLDKEVSLVDKGGQAKQGQLGNVELLV